jgi:hypothetical protein
MAGESDNQVNGAVHLGKTGEATMSNTFCICACKQLHVMGEAGHTSVCTPLTRPLAEENGWPLSVYRNSLEEIWNSACIGSA